MMAWIVGLEVFLHWEVWAALAAGALIGIVFGCIPGLTAAMGVGVFIPVSFALSPVAGIALLIAIYKGGTYGGAISGIMVNVPGTPSSIPTTMAGYPLAKKGYANLALSAAALGSLFGGVVGVAFLIFAGPQVARFALRFGPVEFASLFIFAVTIIAHLSRESMLKGLIAGVLGFLISSIGMDPMVGVPRFHFGMIELYDGVPRIIALIGMFAGVAVFGYLESLAQKTELQMIEPRGERIRIREVLSEWKALLRASVIGTALGFIPGPGGGTSSFVAYADAKARGLLPNVETEGSIRGVLVSEAANNAAVGGALITLFALGIPGDTVTAVLYGGILIQGLTPGPTMFAESPILTYGILISTVFATIFFALFGFFGSKYLARILKAPGHYLWPAVWMMAFIGAFGLYNRPFDLTLILIFAVVGYLLHKGGFPIGPISLGILLGTSFEANLRRALIRFRGDWTVFFTRPISLVLLILTALSIGHAVYSAVKNKPVETLES